MVRNWRAGSARLLAWFRGDHLRSGENPALQRGFHQFLAVLVAGLVVFFTTTVLPFASNLAASCAATAFAMAAALASLRLLSKGRFRASVWLFLSCGWLTLEGVCTFSGGYKSLFQGMSFLLVANAAWLLGKRAALFCAGGTIFAALFLAMAEQLGFVFPVYFALPPLVGWQVQAGVLLLAIGPLLSVLSVADRAASLANSRYAEARESERRLRMVIETASDGIHVLDEQGNVIEANEAFCRMLGYSREETLRLNIADWDMRWKAGEHARNIRRLTDRPGVTETRHRRRDGSAIEVEVNVSATLFDGRRIVCASARDITARKLAEQELARNRALLRAIIEGATDAIFAKDRLGRYILFNQAAARFTGKSPADVLGKNDTYLFPPTEAAAEMQRDRRVLETGATECFEGEFTSSTGEKIALRVAKGPLFDDKGSLVGIFNIAHDTTADKRAEARLRESEEKYRLTFETIPDGVVVYEADGAVSLVNPEAAKLPRGLLDRIAGRDAGRGEPPILCEDGSPCPPEDLPVAKCLRTGEPQPAAILGVRLPGGSTLWAVYSATPLLDPASARLTRVVLACRDVTQQREAERALRRANQQIRLLANNLWDAVLAYDMRGRLLYINPAVEALTGYSVGELQCDGLFKPVCPEDRERMAALWSELYAGRSFPEVEFRIVAKDGQTKWLEASFGPLRDEAGRQVGVQGVARDITDRRRAEAALRESTEKFAKTFRSAPVLISISAAETGRLIDVNDFALEITGFSREEAIGRTLVELGLVSVDDRRRMLQQLQDQGRISGVDVRMTAKDGRTVHGVVYGERTVLQGEDCLLLVVVDATGQKQAEAERRRLEEQLQQAQKLESIGRLAGGVAHDFNNLLTVINGYCELLLANPQTPEIVGDYVGEVRRAGGRAAELTRQLLAFSRKQIVEPRPVSWNDLISESREMLRRMVGEDIEIVAELDSGSGAVMADPGQLHQVLMNLVVNARDAMPAGGRLTLRTRRMVLDAAAAAPLPASTPGPHFVLEVSDTGVGMTQEVRERVFEPFFTTKDAGMGTGLGLSTVYGIVRQAGGWVDVKSAPGAGTTFRIGLPLLKQAAARAAADAPLLENLDGSETILVVEDQDEVRRLALEILSSYRYRTLEARSGEEALAIAEQHPGPIHLALTDVVMPQMTGKQLANQLQTMRPELKVLYMSGYTAEVISRQGVLDSGIDYIQKPFTPEALTRKIRSVLAAAS